MARRKLSITRAVESGSFVYRDRGRKITSRQELARIDALAIPPAWTDVEIAKSPRSKVLARGIDAAGRAQALYHPSFRRQQEKAKFERILRFAERLPALRRRVDQDLRRRGLTRDRVVALVIKLMDDEFFRVGNVQYAKAGHYGITTLRRKHVTVKGSAVDFDFVGKSGKRHRRRIRDARTARLIGSLQDLPGHELFKFFDDDGEKRTVDSRHVNAYVKRHMGREFSAKDFRTWGGTLLAVSSLLSDEFSGTHDREGVEDAAVLREVVQRVAARLGNTPEVTKASYIDPRVFEAAQDGTTVPALREAMKRMRPRRYLSVEEQCVLRMISGNGDAGSSGRVRTRGSRRN